MKIGIIGGGITGLTLAYYLVKNSNNVTIFEKDKELGGLLNSFKVKDFYLERYYHHFFKCDIELIKLINSLGLEDRVIWKETKMGFFANKKIYPFGTPFELLKFKPIGIFDRLRFGLTILYLQKLNKWSYLDKITAKEWLKKFSGKRTYKVLWEPLLRIKFGRKFSDKISAAWIWGRVKPRAKSRSKGLIKEELGYLKGSFKVLVDKLELEIKNMGGEIRKGEYVKEIKKDERGKIEINTGNDKSEKFDKVIFTGPTPLFLKVASKILPENFKRNLEKIKYQSVVCATFILNENLSDIYWLNIADDEIPFGGVIEHTNFISKENYDDFSIVYLFNYLQKDDKMYNEKDDKIVEIYKNGLRKIFPNFNENCIESVFIHRDSYGTPIYVKNYSTLKPNFKTPIKNLFLANTSMIYPFDRNTNNSVKLGREIAKKILFEINS